MSPLLLKLSKIKDIALDILFPPDIISFNLRRISAEEIYERSEKSIGSELPDIFPVLSYKDKLVKSVIWELKYKNNVKVSKKIAEIMHEEIIETLSDISLFSGFEKPMLLPIPLSPKRFKERGYNQADEIAKEIFRLNGKGEGSLRFDANLLVKIKDTESQAHSKNKKERMKNLKDCFAVKDKKAIKGRNIILIDDVVATGSTIEEARRTLLRSGARRVIAFTFAH